MTRRLILFASLAVLVLLIIFVVQNSRMIEVAYFSWHGTAPLSIIMVLTFVIGFGGGAIYEAVTSHLRRKQRDKESLMREYVEHIENENNELKNASNSQNEAE